MMLNLKCKIFIKALQLQMQLILMNIINIDELDFLYMRFILDNIFLIQEIMT